MTPPDVSDDVTRSESDRARRIVRSPQNRPDRARNRSVGIILTRLIVAVSMSSIDQTIVSLSSQTIQTGLSLDSRGIEWIVNSYQLAAAALFPVAGKLADVLGYKRMMLAGTIAFAIGSLLCGLTPQGSLALAWMIVSRVVQGAGLALMFPSAIGILFSHAPEEKRAKYMAMFFAITGGMTAIGPRGVLSHHLLLACRVLHQSASGHRRRIPDMGAHSGRRQHRPGSGTRLHGLAGSRAGGDGDGPDRRQDLRRARHPQSAARRGTPVHHRVRTAACHRGRPRRGSSSGVGPDRPSDAQRSRNRQAEPSSSRWPRWDWRSFSSRRSTGQAMPTVRRRRATVVRHCRTTARSHRTLPRTDSGLWR